MGHSWLVEYLDLREAEYKQSGNPFVSHISVGSTDFTTTLSK